MKGLATGCISLLAVTGLLLLLAAGLSKVSLNADLERARNEWAELSVQEPAVRSVQAATAFNNETLTMLENRRFADHPQMSTVLRAVQENVPSRMTLYHFSAGIEQDREKETRTRILRISGTATGELTAVDAKRQLNTDARLHRFCGEIKLVALRRYFEESWAFALEGRRLTEGGR